MSKIGASSVTIRAAKFLKMAVDPFT